MSKEKNALEQIEQLEVVKDVKDLSSRMGSFYERNRKVINYTGIGIVVLILGYIGYNQFMLKPQEEEAAEDLYKIERYFGLDSVDIVLAGNSNIKSAVEIADDYGSTPSGQKAAYMAGMCYLKKGDFENAISYLKKFKLNDLMVSCLAKGAIGDAYVELNQLDEAVSYYVDAAEKHKNTLTTPYFYKKAALVYEKLGKNDKALKYYEAIKSEYKESAEAAEIEKYIARAQGKLEQEGK